MKRVTDRKNKNLKLPNKKSIIIFIIVLALILLVGFSIVKSLPVKDVTSKDIKISLSTKKVTGKNVDVNIATTKGYDIFYYIDYKDEEAENLDESDYYENALEAEENHNVSNTQNSSVNESDNSNNTTNPTSTSKKTSNLKVIQNSKYTKMTSSTITVENNAIIYLKYGRFGKYSSNPYTFEIDNIDKTGPEIGEIETTSTDSTIKVSVSAIDLKNPNLTYYFKLEEDLDYTCTETENTYTFTKLKKGQTYSIYVKVTDGFGNSSEAVTDAVASSKEVPVAAKKIYHIKVNLAANTVTVYQKDNDGKYTDPVKAMICSVGKATPTSGTYKISVRYRWRELFGNVYGQYAVRIHGNILFHSVPYLNTYPDTLEYEEYDKLGTKASAGCVRLTVEDAKWIYDNAANGTTVEFYSDKDNPGPLGKPKAQKISGNKGNRNWDPTDPDPRNPWIGGNGVVPKVERPSTPVNNDDDITINNNTNTTSNSNSVNNSTHYPIDNNKVWNTND